MTGPLLSFAALACLLLAPPLSAPAPEARRPEGAPPPAAERDYWKNHHLTHPGEAALAWFRAEASSATAEAGISGRLCVALFQTGNYDECLSLAVRVQARAPGEPWSLLARALAEQDRNESEAALAAFERLERADLSVFAGFFLTPGMLRMHKASLLLKLERTAEAEIAVASLLAAGGEVDPPVLKLVECFLLKLGRIDKAIALWEGMLARDPDDPNALVNLASIHVASTLRRDLPRALDLLSRAASRGKDDAQIAYYRFLAHHRAGDRARADGQLRAIAAMDPEAQERLQIEGGEISTYMPATQIFTTAYLCLGRWERMTALLARDLARMHEHSVLLKEDLFPYLPDYETFQFDAMFNYYAAGHPEERPPATPFLSAFEAAFLPRAAEAARALAQAAAAKAAGRLPGAREALARAVAAEPSALAPRILEHERALAAQDREGCFAALRDIRAVRTDPERDPARALARLFAMTVTLDPFWIYDRGDGRVRRYVRTRYTRDFDDARFAELCAIYDELRAGLDGVRERAESESARQVAALLSAYVEWCLNRLPALRDAFLDYVERDPEYRLLRHLYVRFAKN